MTEETEETQSPAPQSRSLHKELSFVVVGCAQRVHSRLGLGFPEAVYHKALAHALVAAKIPFQSKPQFQVCYEGALCVEFQPDLLVDGKIICEPKSVERLCPEHEAQILSYLKATGMKLGLLMNFGEPRLRVKRFVV